jgi:hypothetical protein
MNQPTIVSNFSTLSTAGGQRRDIDYRMQIVRQRESSAPFLTLMLNLNSDPTQTHQFRAFEERPNPKYGTITTAVAAGATANATVTVPVTSGNESYFSPGDVVKANTSVASTGQTTYGIVTAIDTTAHTITVRPNDPAKIISSFNAGAIIASWGKSHAQGTLGASPNGAVPQMKEFYTQIFKHAYSVDKTQANDRLYGAPERDRARAAAEIEHVIEINKALINGDGSYDVTNSTSPRTNITGLFNQFTTNVFEYGDTLNEKTLFDAMTLIHAPKYAPDGNMAKRMVLASADIIKDINNMSISRYRPGTQLTMYGVNVFEVQFMNRTWQFIEDPNLSLLAPGAAIVFHPRYVRLREFRPTVLQPNIQPNDADYFLDQFLTEVGLEVTLEELGAVFMH